VSISGSSWSRPCKDPSAATCTALRPGASALASVRARESSERNPATPASAHRGWRSFAQMRKTGNSVGSEVLPAASSQARRRRAKSRVCRGSIISFPSSSKIPVTLGRGPFAFDITRFGATSDRARACSLEFDWRGACPESPYRLPPNGMTWVPSRGEQP
jgi:hypothetical protein